MDGIYNRKLPTSTTVICGVPGYAAAMPRKTKTSPRGNANARKEFSMRLIRAMDAAPAVPREDGKRNQRRAWMAKKWGISTEMARRYLKGEALPEPSKWTMIADDLGVSRAWLFLADGEMRPRPEGHPLSLKGDNFEQTNKTSADWPLLSWAGLAKQGDAMNRVQEPEPRDRNPLANLSRETFLLVVRGASMEPRFKDGGILFVDPQAKPRHGAYVVARLPGAETATLKQLVVEDGRRLLKATNPAWPDQFTPLGAGEIIGVVKFYGEEV